MTTTARDRQASAALDFEALFDALLYAVSHDLKSPLLSIGLGAELLEGASGDGDRTRLAREAMQRGAEDLTRHLEALTLLSRARRRPLDSAPLDLASLLPADATTAGLEGVRVAVDGRLVVELHAELSQAGAPRVVAGDADVRLVAALPPDTPRIEGGPQAPLEALLGALSTHAGTLVGRLAVLQVQLERQGGTLVLGAGQATALLPRAR